MNKANLIKSLECCTADFCTGCPLADKEPDSCVNELNSEVINFIERQESEIAYLKRILEIANAETQAAHKANITYVCQCEQSRLESLKKLGEDIKSELDARLCGIVPFPSVITEGIDKIVNKAIGNKSNNR